MPFARAEVITLLANQNLSFKISSPKEWMGAIRQDRNAAIAGRIGERVPLLPLAIHLRRESGGAPRSYRMEMVRDRGLHEKCAILAGVIPLKSAGMAKHMKKNVPGMDVPDSLIERLSGVPKEKQAEEGIKICVEMIQQLKEIKGVRGVHIMAIEWEQKVAEIAQAAGLSPRPQA